MNNPAHTGKTRGISGLLSLLLATILLLTACEYSGSSLRMMVTDYPQFEPEALQGVIEERSSVRFELADVGQDIGPLQALVTDLADLALVENNVAFKPGIRAILPVFQSVLHLAARDAYYHEDPERTLENADFYVANRSSAGKTFVELVMHREGFEPGQYRVTSTFEEEQTDFIIYFGPINPGNTNWLRPGFSMVSLDDQLNPRRKFYEEGIGYNAPGMQPTVIHALT